MLENGPGHRTVPTQRQLPNAFGEFAPRNVPGLVERLDDRVQRLQDEEVGVCVEARIPLLELVQDVVGEL